MRVKKRDSVTKITKPQPSPGSRAEGAPGPYAKASDALSKAADSNVSKKTHIQIRHFSPNNPVPYTCTADFTSYWQIIS